MLRTLTARRTLPVALLAAGALLLAGCGGGGKANASHTPTSSPTATTTAVPGDGTCHSFQGGDASNAVKVAGTFGKTQTVTFAKPLKADDLQRTVLTTGTGAKTAPGQKVNTLVTAYNATSGKQLGSTSLPVVVGDKGTIEAFSAAVECLPFGSRVVIAVPAAQMYGPAGRADINIKGTDTIVIVADVIGKYVPPAPPKTSAWTTRAPKVTFAAGGKPTLKLFGAPPKQLLLKVLRKGTGAVVKSGDTVTVDYQGTIWRNKTIFDQSYGRQPATFVTTGVVPGFGAALVGQKVGTRVVVSIPAKYGYGAAGNPQAGINGTDTLVFVIEIKATKAAG